jgi:hypothetical protein
LNEAKKNTLTAAAREALAVGPSGMAAVYEKYAEAARNSNDAAMAKQFEDAAQFAKDNPDAALTTTRAMYAGLDEKGYEAAFGRTADIQNYEYFKQVIGPQKAEEIIGVTPKDGIQVLPNGMVIAGPESPLAKAMSGTGTPTIPTVTTEEEMEALPPGAEFRGPDGKTYVKKGGPAGNGGGTFPQ